MEKQMDKPTDGIDIIAIDDKNLTAFEKAIRDGKGVDVSGMINKVSPKEVSTDDDVISKTVKGMENSSIKRLLNNAPTKPQEVKNMDFNELSEDQKKAMLEFLSKAANVDKSGTKPEAPTATVPPAPKLNTPAKDVAPPPEKDCKCPNCGWDTEQTIGEPSKDDKRAWLRAILANKPFEKTYTLFDGQLSVRFRSRTVHDQQLIHEQLVKETALGSIPDKPPHLALASHGLRMRQLSLAASYVQNSAMDTPLPPVGSEAAKQQYGQFINDNTNAVAAAYIAIFSEWSEPLFNSVMKLMVDFDTLCFRLMDASVTSDFWKETAG